MLRARGENLSTIGTQNDPMMMVYGSLEAYGQVVSFCEEFFFAPHFVPPQGGKNTPKMPLFDQKCQKNVKKVDSVAKNGPMMMIYGSLEAYVQVVSFFYEFFSPPLTPSGGQKHPKTPLFVKKCQKSL